MTVKVILLRPLDGKLVGAIADYPETDALRLERRGAVEIVKGKSAPKLENKMERQPQNKAGGKPVGKAD